MRSVEDIQRQIREQSPLSPELTEEVIRARYQTFPRRLAFALDRWPLATSKVLDVGSSWGHTLIHFGPGSLGVDNHDEFVGFVRALGLEAVLTDVDDGLGEVPDGAFDYVFVSDIIEHVDAPRLLLRRLRPKLKPGGSLLLFISTLPRTRLTRALSRRVGLDSFEKRSHHYQFTRDTTRYLVERAGYRVERIAVPPLTGPLARLDRLAAPYAPRLWIEGVPDTELEQIVITHELKNKPDKEPA